ncbi:MAG: RNA-binding protein [Kiritimatiellia bacterium]|nr:RNA-binding protein [Kiritimatiellia bacterium]MDP6847349.1 RNA-binding protein [Kiritimatiellia bacterium]
MEIYVGNLAYSVSNRDVAKAFGRYGEVLDVRIIRNKANGKSKGYGFVEMADQRGADEAVSEMNGAEIKGRRIVANEAKSNARDRD